MQPASSLSRKIGLWAAISLVAGSIIGSGVFMKPAGMAAQLGSPIWLTIVWIIAGVFSLCGAIIFSELGAMFPETGGIYVYFKKMFGDKIAFLYGWAAFAVINTAATAAIAFVCAFYANSIFQLPQFPADIEMRYVWRLPFIGDLFPLKDAGVKALAISLVTGLTWLNYRSVKSGSSFQLISTIIKIVVIAVLVFGLFLSGNGSFLNFISPSSGGPDGLLSGIIAAMTGAFFAYDGWINASFMAGEIDRPQKNVPKSMAIGVVICIVVYVLVNQAYLYVMPVQQIAESPLVAGEAMRIAWGNTSGTLIAGMIVLCTIGAINGNAMATARVTYAMGKDKTFSPWTGKEHPRFQTPGNALWLHAIWTSLFIITGSFDMLADMFVFVTWVAYGLGAIGIFTLRKKMPHQPRPYKIWGHPFVTIIFILFTVTFLFITIYNDVRNYMQDRQPVVNSLLGIMITLLGVPLYYYFRRKNKRSV